MISNIIGRLKTNWRSGVTVALVSIPLSVSLAVASQTSPAVGILTAIWAGLIASICGGSNFNVVGPTGALSGILAAYAIGFGANSLPMLAIVTGIIILCFYLLKFEKYIALIPGNTIHGFTLGVAFIIGLNQLNYALGLRGLTVHEKFIDNLIESIKHLSNLSIESVVIFFIFLILLFVFKKFLPKFPGAIILTPIGILLGYMSINHQVPLTIQTLSVKYPDIKGTLFIIPHFYFNWTLIKTAITVALVAIIETMVSAKIADGMTKTKHHKRREMLGLSLANIVSGLMGGMPATAALARTSLNIKTGANFKLSATISSLTVAVISLLMLPLFKFIPLAVIAAILVYVAIQMIEAEHFVRMFKVDKKSFLLAMFVATITIVEDPIWGILLGTVISLLMTIDSLRQGYCELVINDNKKIVGRLHGTDIRAINKKGKTLVYSIKGRLDSVNSQSHISRFETDLNGYKNIVLRMREVYFIDLDGVDALNNIISDLHKNNRRVLITGVNPLVNTLINEECKNYKQLIEQGLVFSKTQEALEYLSQH